MVKGVLSRIKCAWMSFLYWLGLGRYAETEQEFRGPRYFVVWSICVCLSAVLSVHLAGSPEGHDHVMYSLT